ncbi:unnamed protein product [Durusdinium trenchii]|uniref:2'-phosphotransferase n=1 Tax=Durusdinium trenchii TaxID=1381693 RepID=A0ABP0LXJ0_9DINO
MGRWDHSRSPRQGRLQWISKTLAQLGRYKQNRPYGLEVDGSGCIKLSNLMETWGNSNGVSQDEVVQAVSDNLVNERTGGARFKLSHEGRETIIQVHRAGGEWPSNSEKTSSWSSSSWNGNSSWGAKNQNNDKQDSWKSDQSWNKKNDWDNHSSNGNHTESWVKSEPSENWNKRGNAAGWRLQQGSQSTQNSTSWNNRGGRQGSYDKAEQIQRYMAYLLKNGWQEGVNADREGYADLQSIVDAMQQRKPDFGLTSIEEVKTFLQETDQEGRFAIDAQDRVRKIDRNARQQPPEPQPWKSHTTTTRPSQAQPARSQPARFNAFEAPTHVQKEEVDYDEDEPEADDTPGVSQVKTEINNRKPKNPPGKHWTQYDDNTTIWWYYEGPRGVWWMGPEHSEPQPYNSAPAVEPEE